MIGQYSSDTVSCLEGWKIFHVSAVQVMHSLLPIGEMSSGHGGVLLVQTPRGRKTFWAGRTVECPCGDMGKASMCAKLSFRFMWFTLSCMCVHVHGVHFSEHTHVYACTTFSLEIRRRDQTGPSATIHVNFFIAVLASRTAPISARIVSLCARQFVLDCMARVDFWLNGQKRGCSRGKRISRKRGVFAT